MIIEFFGLSRTGKTTLMEKIRNKNFRTLTETSDLIKLFYFLRRFFKSPIKVSYLLYKLNRNYLKLKQSSFKKYLQISIMRNSYLIGTLSKYERAITKKGIVISDELPTQSLFMILQSKSTAEEVKKVLAALPLPEILFIFELPKKFRELRHKSTRYPAQWIDKSYALDWLENSEFNYEIIKKELLHNPQIKEVKLINSTQKQKIVLQYIQNLKHSS